MASPAAGRRQDDDNDGNDPYSSPADARDWQAMHHWDDPGPPSPAQSAGFQSAIERQLTIQARDIYVFVGV